MNCSCCSFKLTEDDGPINYRFFLMAKHYRVCEVKRFVDQVENELKEKVKSK